MLADVSVYGAYTNLIYLQHTWADISDVLLNPHPRSGKKEGMDSYDEILYIGALRVRFLFFVNILHLATDSASTPYLAQTTRGV